MSADLVLFHSSEVDDAALLAEGWYIGAVAPGADALTTGGAVGPYATMALAAKGMAAGDWLAAAGIDEIAHSQHAGMAGGFDNPSKDHR